MMERMPKATAKKTSATAIIPSIFLHNIGFLLLPLLVIF
jgi:hypothetical protein